MPSTKILEMKKDIVNEIKNKIDNSKTIVLFDYSGLTDNASKDLRIKLKESDSDYKIYKNTLLKLAFKDLNIDLNNYLEGPTAIVFSSDDIAAIKVLSDCAKKNDTLQLKVGIVEGNIADKSKLNEFATIPSRDGLYTMLACGMIGIVKDLSIALNLLSEQKES
jgi:large subunit ribosomal protein L10